MENLNDVEFGSDNDGKEAPLLVAQRYLNIFRQIHIFNQNKRNEFDDELLALPTTITDFFKRMPGGRLLVEHIEKVKTERGISFVKSSKEDFDEGAGKTETPTVVAGGGGSVVIDASFAETLAQSLANAFKQIPTAGLPSGSGASVDFGNAFDVIAEEIRMSRTSLLDVLKETRSVTDSVIASQVSISRILESILSSRTRDDADVTSLNNRIIASQASITKLLEGIYTTSDKRNNEISDYLNVEAKLSSFKSDIEQKVDNTLMQMQSMLDSYAKSFKDKKIIIETPAPIVQPKSAPKTEFSKPKLNRDYFSDETIAELENDTASSVEEYQSSDYSNLKKSQHQALIQTEHKEVRRPQAPVQKEREEVRQPQASIQTEHKEVRRPQAPVRKEREEVRQPQTPIQKEREEVRQPQAQISINSAPSIEGEVRKKKKKKKKKNHNGEQISTEISVEAQPKSEVRNSFDTQNIKKTAQVSVVAAPAFDGIIRNNDYKYDDDFKNIKLDEQPIDISNSLDVDIESNELPNLDNFSDDGLDFELPQETPETLDEAPREDLPNLDDFASDGLDFELPQETPETLDEAPREDLPNLDDFASDGLDFELQQETPETFDEVPKEDSPNLDDFASDGLDFELPQETPETLDEAPKEDLPNLDDFASDGLDFELPQETPETFDEAPKEDSPNLDDFASDGLDFGLPQETPETFDEAPKEDLPNLDDFASDGLDFELPQETPEALDEAPKEGLPNLDNTETSSDEIYSAPAPEQPHTDSLYSSEMEKIRQALTSDIDLSSMDEPIQLDDYNDDENVSDADEGNDEEISSNISNQSDDDWEWEYVDENEPSEQSADTSTDSTNTEEDWDWEYVDENGNPISENADESADGDWEWEYVDEDNSDNNNTDKK